MKLLICIDDTDNQESPGTGHLAEQMACTLKHDGLITRFSPITRHQLLVHPSVPYTSHNSAMCFGVETCCNQLDDIIAFGGRFLEEHAAAGSDPGLCILPDTPDFRSEQLIAFGLRAKQTVIRKEEAHHFAHHAGIHLSEHGGSGDGIIGALAGIGLRKSGNDGRFRGWLPLGNAGDTLCVHDLLKHQSVEMVITDDQEDLAEETEIYLAEATVKTILRGNRRVLPVTRSSAGNPAGWTTLTKSQVKRF